MAVGSDCLMRKSSCYYYSDGLEVLVGVSYGFAEGVQLLVRGRAAAVVFWLVVGQLLHVLQQRLAVCEQIEVR